jgi:hypothetical protein
MKGLGCSGCGEIGNDGIKMEKLGTLVIINNF